MINHQLLEDLDKTNIGELLAAKKILDSNANKRCMEDLREEEFINDKKSLVAEEV